MALNIGSRLTSSRRWLKTAGRDIFRSADFILAALTFPLAFYATLRSSAIRSDGVAFLVGAAALGVALAGIVFAVLAVTAAWFDETYRKVLQATRGGWRGAMRPYKVVGIVGLTVALVATLAGFTWSIAPAWLQAFGLACALSLAVWTLVGSIQLIGITFFHGEMRSELLKGMEEARKALARRRNQKSAG